MTQQGVSSLSGRELKMLRVLGAASERKQNFSAATRFRSGRSFLAKRVLRECSHSYSRLCGPLPKVPVRQRAPGSLRAKSSPTSNFRQPTPPLNTHRNSPPRNLMHRAGPVTGISAMPPPSTRQTKRALLRVSSALCKSAIFGDDPRQGHGVVHADINDGLRRELHFFPFARQNVRAAPNQPYPETAGHMTEDCADQSASAGSN